jgi:tetratricopeptide (TPR) repeat protein
MKSKILFLLLIAFAITQSVFGQITITGTVKSDEDGVPIPGVSISEKGTSHSAISDMDGKFQINVAGPESVLVFTFIGYTTQEVTVGTQTQINVSLGVDAETKDEVVVIGYGMVKRSDITGSVVSVSSQPMNSVPISSGGNSILKTPKTWKRSGGTENAVRLSIGDGENDYIPLIGTHMDVTVDGFRARVVINYYFYSTQSRAEGTFKIRMPVGASPSYFAFGSTVYLDNEKRNKTTSFKDYYDSDSVYLTNSRIIETKTKHWKQPKEAKVVPVSEAAYAYTETVRGRIDPMLAEWAGADVFNCRVFPIEQNQVHRVVIAYDVNLTNIGVDKVFNLSIPKTNSTTIVDMDIAKIDGVETIISQKSGVNNDGKRVKLHLENPDKEEISIRYQNPDNILLLDNQEKYFAYSLTINLPEIKSEKFSGNAVFMLDISASSNPDKFNVWLKLLKAILENNEKDIKQFNVLFFNIETFWFKNNYVENNEKNREAFFSYCDKLSLEGATDIGAAISEVCKPEWENIIENKNIFLLSDGSISWGEENLYSISKFLNDNSRIYVYNTGISGTDMNMLEHLARESGGILFSVTGEDEIKQASTAFKFDAWKISSLKLAGCQDLLIEGRPKFLYAGQKIIVTGRGIPKNNSKLELNLKNGSSSQSLSYQLDKNIVSELTKRIYGQIAVNQLESFDFFTEKNSIAYAKYYKVPGKTCSMLMLETQADYDRYKIDLSEDSSIVNELYVNSIIDKTLNEIGKSEGMEKEKFFYQLSQLEKAPNAKFTLSDSLKSLINKIPSEKFRIITSRLDCKRHLKSELPVNVLAELDKEEIKYYVIEYESDSLEEKYGVHDALKMLSTIVERNPGNGNLIRDVAFSAMRLGLSEHAYYLFKRVMEKVPNEPHAYHALAQILSDMGNFDLALLYYEIAYTTNWDGRFGDMKTIVGLDYLRFLRAVKNSNHKISSSKFAEMRLNELENLFKQKGNRFNIKNINMMLSITWNTNNSDVDLHVKEPSGEECFYSYQNTKSGGCLTYDVTQGYGPEMYINPANLKGTYNASVHYFSDVANRASTRSQVYVVIYENWGKKNEKVTRKVVSLKDRNQTQEITKIQVDQMN